jgi:hypothetical protein
VGEMLEVWRKSQSVECLSSKHEVLSSNPSTRKEGRREGGRKEKEGRKEGGKEEKRRKKEKGRKKEGKKLREMEMSGSHAPISLVSHRFSKAMGLYILPPIAHLYTRTLELFLKMSLSYLPLYPII